MKILLAGSNILPNIELLSKNDIKLDLISKLDDSYSYMMTLPENIKIINASSCIDGIRGQLLLNGNNEPIVNLSLNSVDPMRQPNAEHDYVSFGKVIVYPVKLPSIEQIKILKEKSFDEYMELVELMQKSSSLNVTEEKVDNNELLDDTKLDNIDVEYNDINLDYIPENFNHNKRI